MHDPPHVLGNLWSTTLPHYKGSNFPIFSTWGGTSIEWGSGLGLTNEGIYVVGTTSSFGAGREDLVLVKWDTEGHLLWNRTWGGFQSDFGENIVVDQAGNIFTVCNSQSFGNQVLIKWDSNGNQLWNRTWSEGRRGWETKIIMSNESIYTVDTRLTWDVSTPPHWSEFVDYSLMLRKWETNGTSVWSRTWGGDYDYVFGVATSSDASIYTVGTAGRLHPELDLELIKWDSEGNQLWNQTWDSSRGDWGRDIAIDRNGDIYTAGYTTSNETSSSDDFLLVKWDLDGNQLWNRTAGGSDIDWGFGITIDNMDNIYVVGTTTTSVMQPGAIDPTWYSGLILAKWDSTGRSLGFHYWTVGDAHFAIQSVGDVTVSNEKLYCVGEVHQDLALLVFSTSNFSLTEFPSNEIPLFNTPDIEFPLVVLTICLLIGARKRKIRVGQT